jgi:hypothetical protein
VKAAAMLSNPATHSEAEVAAAPQRFRDQYVTELSMVESHDVEERMQAFAAVVDKELTSFTPAQHTAYRLAHALRDSYVAAGSFRAEPRRGSRGGRPTPARKPSCATRIV